MAYQYISPHREKHKSQRAGWLRAAVLAMNDGVVTNSSIMLGVLAASDSNSTVITAGIAGLFAGALSMALGEYVSVSSQRDSQKADIEIEKKSIAEHPKEELAELAWIYEQRGLDHDLAQKVAEQLSARNAVNAHARDELNIDEAALSNPIQAAVASIIACSIGSFIPIFAILLPFQNKILSIVVIAVVALALSGVLSASLGGGRKLVSSLRLFIGGAIAMTITYFIGRLIHGS